MPGSCNDEESRTDARPLRGSFPLLLIRFAAEAPPEKRGRVHTSTVTVAVLPVPDGGQGLDPADVEIVVTGSGGKGGQHVNKRDTAVIATHRPTGARVRIEGRSQHQNRAVALEILAARVGSAEAERRRRDRNSLRQSQVGRGMRADKRRTVAIQRGSVVDHETGREVSARQYLRGYLDELWS